MTQLQSPSLEFTIEDMEIRDRERRSNLTIIGTQPSDAGAYRCEAVNEPGIGTDHTTLTVHGEINKISMCTMYIVLFVMIGLFIVQWFQASCSHR